MLSGIWRVAMIDKLTVVFDDAFGQYEDNGREYVCTSFSSLLLLYSVLAPTMFPLVGQVTPGSRTMDSVR